MKVAIVFSQGREIPNIMRFLPPSTSELLCISENGIPVAVAACAQANHFSLTAFSPERNAYDSAVVVAFLMESLQSCDCILAFWNGKPDLCAILINRCHAAYMAITVHMLPCDAT